MPSDGRNTFAGLSVTTLAWLTHKAEDRGDACSIVTTR